MDFTRVLTEETVSVALRAGEKPAAIEEMLDLVMAGGGVRDRAAALAALLDREARMSTGMQHGMALPHAKTDAVDHLRAAVGISPEGIPFDSLDGEPARILIMTLSPLNRTGPHIQFLAEIGRLLSSPAARARVLAARTPAELLAILREPAA